MYVILTCRSLVSTDTDTDTFDTDTFGLALVLTQHEVGDVDGRLSTATTIGMAGVVALGTVTLQGGFHLPQVAPGWWGLAALTGGSKAFLTGKAILDLRSEKTEVKPYDPATCRLQLRASSAPRPQYGQLVSPSSSSSRLIIGSC